MFSGTKQPSYSCSDCPPIWLVWTARATLPPGGKSLSSWGKGLIFFDIENWWSLSSWKQSNPLTFDAIVRQIATLVKHCQLPGFDRESNFVPWVVTFCLADWFWPVWWFAVSVMWPWALDMAWLVQAIFWLKLTIVASRWVVNDIAQQTMTTL